MTAPENAKPRPRPARIGFEGLLGVLLGYRDEAGRDGNSGGGALDRMILLRRAGRELGLSERGLLERGFDKAYRRMVEGV